MVLDMGELMTASFAMNPGAACRTEAESGASTMNYPSYCAESLEGREFGSTVAEPSNVSRRSWPGRRTVQRPVTPVVSSCPLVDLSGILQGYITGFAGVDNRFVFVRKKTGESIPVEVTPQQAEELRQVALRTRCNLRVLYSYDPVADVTGNYRLLEWVRPRAFDEAAFDAIVKKTSPAWADIEDHVAWVRQQRGGEPS